jgi:hypothetical protein
MVNNVTARLNSFEEACRNEFGRISSEFNASIESLRNEMIQRYVIARKLQIDFDQLSVANQSEASSGSSFGKEKKPEFIDISMLLINI